MNQRSARQGSLPNGADNNGIRAYYDLGVPIPRQGGIAGGIANGDVGGIAGGVANGSLGGVNNLGGGVARPDGLDFSVEFPPDESGIADGNAASGGVPVDNSTGIGGGVANSGAASAETFPPDISSQDIQSTAGSGMFNGRTSAGFSGLDANSGASATQSPGSRAGGGGQFQSRRAAGGTAPSARPNGRNQRSSDRLNQRFGDDF